MMIAILIIALLFFLVPGAALAVMPPPDCEDEECIRDATPDMAGCWTMECVKQELIDSCELEQQPEYIDCNNILRCINNVTEAQSEYCAGDGYPAIVFRKVVVAATNEQQEEEERCLMERARTLLLEEPWCARTY